MRTLAERLKPQLAIDRQHLHENGYTPASNATELAAVIETVFTELYSAVDCGRKVLSARYPVQGMPDSTRKTFDRAQKGVFDGELPDGLVSLFKNAHWYVSLRELRDELTHSDIGSISQDETTEQVAYMHTGLGSRETALVINDVFARMDADIEAVNRFLGTLFLHLNNLLTDAPTVQVCGLHQGKVLMRQLWPEAALNFDIGKCLAIAWIEVEGKPTCPLLCGAYWRAKEQQPQSNQLCQIS